LSLWSGVYDTTAHTGATDEGVVECRISTTSPDPIWSFCTISGAAGAEPTGTFRDLIYVVTGDTRMIALPGHGN